MGNTENRRVEIKQKNKAKKEKKFLCICQNKVGFSEKNPPIDYWGLEAKRGEFPKSIYTERRRLSVLKIPIFSSHSSAPFESILIEFGKAERPGVENVWDGG